MPKFMELLTGKYYHDRILWGELEKYGLSPSCAPSMELNNWFYIWVKEKRYQIDAIGKRGEFTYIIETKPNLNYEAIGQVFVYEFLYREYLKGKNLKEKIKKGILCKNITDQVLLSVCSEKDITVFELTKNGIEEHPPNVV